jgi:uncharacterized Zn finger protein
MTDNKLIISISCDKCGTISHFEFLVEREVGAVSNLECESCGWSLAKIDIQKPVTEFGV